MAKKKQQADKSDISPVIADAPKASKARRPLYRRVLRVVGYVLLVPIVLVAAVLLYLHTDSGQELVRAKLVERLSQRINGSVAIGELEFALGGTIRLGAVTVSDESGAEVVSIKHLEVALAWSDSGADHIIIDDVALSGVQLNVEQYEDGSSNLKKLVKATPPPKEPPAPPKRRRVEVRKLGIADVGLNLAKFDGTRMELKELGVIAALDLTAVDKHYDVRVARIGASSFTLDKRSVEGGGVLLEVSGFETGVDLTIDGEARKVDLKPTKAHIAVLRPGEGETKKELDLELAGIGVNFNEGDLTASLGQLLAGAVVLDALEVDGNVVDGDLSGQQSAKLTGLRVNAKKLNALLGKELLISDVKIATDVAGPPEAIVLKTDIVTDGGKIALGAKVDVHDAAQPEYEATLTVTDLSTDKLLGSGVTLSKPIACKTITLGVKGKGSKPDTVNADIALDVEDLAVGKIAVDSVALRAHFEDGKLTITSLVVHALEQQLLVDGEYRLADKYVDATVTVDADAGVLLANLREAGIPVSTNLPPGLVRLPKGALNIHAKGNVDGLMDVDVDAPRLAALGGTVSIKTKAALRRNPAPKEGDKAVTVSSIDADVRLNGIDIGTVLALRGKKLDDMEAKASGHIVVKGTPEQPEATFALDLNARATDPRILTQPKAPPLLVRIRGGGGKTGVNARVTAVRLDQPGETVLLDLKASVPLAMTDTYRGIAPYRPLSITLDVPQRALDDLLPMLPRKMVRGKTLPQDVKFSLHADVKGTAAKPEGHVELRAGGKFFAGTYSRVSLDADLKEGDAPMSSKLLVDTQAWLDDDRQRTATIAAQVDFSRSPLLPGEKSLAWASQIAIEPLKLSDLPIPAEKRKGFDGTISANFDLSGNRTDVLGTIEVNAQDLNRPAGPEQDAIGPLAAKVRVELKNDLTLVDIGADVAGARALGLAGTVGAPGKGLILAIKEKRLGEAPLALQLVVPERPLADYRAVKAKLADFPGMVGGAIAITGKVSEPLVKGDLGYYEFETISGERGRVGVDLSFDETAGKLLVTAGPTGAPELVAITAEVSRAEVLAFSKGELLNLSASMKASEVDLKRVVPKFVSKRPLVFEGQLDWDMNVKAVLSKTPEGTKVIDGAANGDLVVSRGRFTIPDTTRTYDDIAIEIRADRDALRIANITASESDRERDNRKLSIHGQVGLDNLRPRDLALNLHTDQWLLFGSPKIGDADAPRGCLSIDADVKGWLNQPVRRIDVNVAALEVLIPDRFERAHQSELTHEGDVLMLADKNVKLGKLPVPESVKAAAEAKKNAAPRAPAKKPPVVDPSLPETGTDIYVTIPNQAHVLQSPMDLRTVGNLEIKVRPEGRKIKGKLIMVGGSLSLGGKDHRLKEGELFFDETCPTGCLDLHFAKKLEMVTLRDVSHASASSEVHIKMTGPISDRVTKLSGAASPGTLFDLLSAHNAGRARYLTQPDMPATETVEFPQHNNLLVLSFLSVNMPHLLFLDRVAAWADPYDYRGAYGKVQHYEGEVYDAENRTRVKVIQRPRAAGQSEAEVQVDWMWNHPESRAVYGIGMSGGSRAGGGPGVFFEWSSED